MSAEGPHLLIISLGSEPLPHVSAARPTWMGRELTAQGWDVSILSVDWSEPSPRPVSVSDAVERALVRASPRVVGVDGRLANKAFDPSAGPKTLEPSSAEPVLRRAKTLVNTLGWGPFAGWARLAYRAAEILHAARPVDIVWAIHGDDSAHAVAYRLRRRLGIPWVADFKDPWNIFHSFSALPLQRWATARRLRTAAAITETCAAQAAADEREFGRAAHVIYSGYDPELMASVTPERPGGGFSLAYLGSVAAVHDVRLLPELCVELRNRGGIERHTLHQYARPAGQLRALLEPCGCAQLVRDHDRVPQSRAFALMRGADVLLLFPMTAGIGTFVGVKEIEYFASGTPVLLLGEPLAELTALIAACPQVRVARNGNEAADFLESEADARRQGRSGSRGEVNSPAVAPLTWRTQAERLSEVLSESTRSPGDTTRALIGSVNSIRSRGALIL